MRFGPLSARTIAGFTPKIRAALIAPKSGISSIVNLMRLVQVAQSAADKAGYVVNYPGFEAVFGIPLTSAPVPLYVRWPDDIAALPGDGSLEQKLVAAFQSALDSLATHRDEFDIAIVHIPDRWFPVSRAAGFDAHDVLKAMGARAGIPTQVLNDRVFSYAKRTPASVAWRLSIALYVKAGGVPWKLAPLPGISDGTAYIGLAYALRPKGEHMHYVTCCSQVFDMDGGGMQFVAFEAREPVDASMEARRNPFLNAADMRAVLARSLSLYQRRNGGTLPTRLVIHKTTGFRAEELEGIRDATTAIKEIECIEVGASTWRGVWMVKRGGQRPQADGYPVPRGTVQTISETRCLLWAAGNAPTASTRSGYFQGSKGIPKPLLLTRHVGAGMLDTVALEVLALTKMDWNNDALYDPVPVTIRYSQKLARTIANVPDLPGESYPYRLFM
ncbi:nuclease PIN [Luteibacter sp. 3190]|uniref:argonaute/piwi family protein n=1 Tax=Luteibacter sp. 3190 TaxID=2817736 RepID=UPI0028578018|nr:nuclease PIN [Luteibacter sp. 3190]MDR6935343.1 hypothetical protein [Luteibacter sp. 3190]